MLDSVRGLHVVLLIGLVYGQTTIQGCIYNDPKCHCGNYYVTCYNLSAVPVLMRGNGTRILDLKFHRGDITSITKTSLPPRLKSITLFNNPLTDLSDDAFDLSAASLDTLFIKGAKFNTLPRALLRLTALVYLRIDDTPIHTWESANLQHFSRSVRNLLLRNVTFTAWPRWMGNFTLLNYLDLSYNTIKYIPEDAFSSLTHRLRTLHLEGTGLVSLPMSILTLVVLETFNLADNSFENLPRMKRILAMSQFQTSLSNVSLASNDLDQIPSFSHFRKLESADFSHNLIKEVPVGALPDTLKYLDLSNNILDDIPRGIGNLQRLLHVDLQGNRILYLRSEAFPPNVTSINLSNNRFSYIRAGVFNHLFRLKKLRLDVSALSIIDHRAFENLASLKLLTLARTLLNEVPPAFISLSAQVNIRMTTLWPLTCPCPPNKALVNWYSSLTTPTLKSVNCTNGLGIDQYLTGQCFPQH